MPSHNTLHPWAVTLVDGSTENLVIKPLPITGLYQWVILLLADKEPEAVALCVGKDLDWINALDIDSFAKLAGKCSEINYPLAVALAKHAPGAAAKVAPLMQKSLLGLKVMAILANELEGAVGIAIAAK
jgi:hypothetical protein